MVFKTIQSQQKGGQKGSQIAIVRKQPPAIPPPETILTFQNFLKFLESHEQVYSVLLKQRLATFRGTMAEWRAKFEEIKREPAK